MLAGLQAVWTGVRNLTSTGIWSPENPAHSELYTDCAIVAHLYHILEWFKSWSIEECPENVRFDVQLSIVFSLLVEHNLTLLGTGFNTLVTRGSFLLLNRILFSLFLLLLLTDLLLLSSQVFPLSTSNYSVSLSHATNRCADVCALESHCLASVQFHCFSSYMPSVWKILEVLWVWSV